MTNWIWLKPYNLLPTSAMLESLTNTQVLQYHKIEPKDTVSTSKCTVQLASARPLLPLLQPITSKEIPNVAQGSPVDPSGKKRKRDASPSSNSDKRARHSAEVKRTAASQNDRPSPTPRNFPTTSSSSSRSVNRWSSIARCCAASSRTDSTDFVSSYEIVKGNLNNFKVCEYLFLLCRAAFVALVAVMG
jgi:hypothetical protein